MKNNKEVFTGMGRENKRRLLQNQEILIVFTTAYILKFIS
jgi:hypothetical protein